MAHLSGSTKAVVAAFGIVLAGCAHSPSATHSYGPTDQKGGPRTLTPDQQALRQAEAEHRAAEELRRARQGEINAAYDQGVQNTLEEFRGRMQARQGFVYQPPIMEWVDMPAQVTNGALLPAHKQLVIVSPGRWVEDNYAGIPADVIAASPSAGVPVDEAPAAPAPVASRFEYVDGQ